jgi:uncharacterized protein YukE
MTFDFQVDTSALAAGKGPFTSVADQVADTAQRVQGVAQSSSAAGRGDLSGAISGFCDRWAAELRRIENVCQVIGSNLEATAMMYEGTEQTYAGQLDTLGTGMGGGPR